ncbi:MAG TPA: DEAD/DEAH box helicase [Phycisphaerales bacterium]|nr:DEAD/DEAH box helicase [Phycisphaerales bacterium]
MSARDSKRVPPIKFSQLGLSEPIAQAVKAEGYDTPTPIQAQAIPHILAGKDLMGLAQTGTGKTAAFALPLIDILGRTPQLPRGTMRPIRALILTPTRELAAQIAESIRVYGKFTTLTYATVFGGVNQNPQARAMTHGVDILIATPGRLLDLLNQGYGDMSHINVLILDEADRMLDMGFIHDIRRIVGKLPKRDAKHPRQTLLFSATMPADIKELAHSLLHDPVQVKVAHDKPTADRIDQCVYHVDRINKPALLRHLLQREFMTRVVVFTRTKHGADRVARDLVRVGINAEAIHGNKRQAQRIRTMAGFRSGDIPVLVATDIAARGIDVDEVSHVINYEIPEVAETYVHRIGRTARAGASGHAITFCSGEERILLRDVERFTKKPIPVKNDQPDYSDPAHAPVRMSHGHNAQQDDRRRPASTSRGERGGHGARQAPRSAPQSAPRSSHAPRPSHSSRPAHAEGNGYAPRDEHPQREQRSHREPHAPHSPRHTGDSPRPAHSARPSHPKPSHGSHSKPAPKAHGHSKPAPRSASGFRGKPRRSR